MNGARYTTAELIDLEKKILEANEKALTLELEILKHFVLWFSKTKKR